MNVALKSFLCQRIKIVRVKHKGKMIRAFLHLHDSYVGTNDAKTRWPPMVHTLGYGEKLRLPLILTRLSFFPLFFLRRSSLFSFSAQAASPFHFSVSFIMFLRCASTFYSLPASHFSASFYPPSSSYFFFFLFLSHTCASLTLILFFDCPA